MSAVTLPETIADSTLQAVSHPAYHNLLHKFANQVYNPFDTAYGAYGGLADDTAAIQAAIDAAEANYGGIVTIPCPMRVTSLNMKPNVELRGIGGVSQTSAQGAGLIGLDNALPVIEIGRPTLSDSMTIRDMQILNGLHCIGQTAGWKKTVKVTLSNLVLTGPVEACIYFAGSTEQLYVREVRCSYGKYSFRHARILDGYGDAYLERSYFDNMVCSVATENAFLIEANQAGPVLFNNITSTGISKEAVVVEGNGAAHFTWIGYSSETSCLTPTNSRRTTGSITSGTAALTLADATGYVVGDLITVQGAGSAAGLDKNSWEILGIVGSVLTMSGNAAATVTDGAVTRALYSDFRLRGAAQNGGTQHTFIGCQLAGTTTALYAVDLANVGGQIVFIACEISLEAIPIYDPLGMAVLIGGDATYIRVPNIAGVNKLRPNSSARTYTKAGTPADTDFLITPPDGTVVTDTTASKIWTRIGGTWKGVVVA